MNKLLPILAFFIFMSFLFSNEKFIQSCKSNCNTVYMNYGFKGNYASIDDDNTAHTSNDGLLMGYDYKVLSAFKNRIVKFNYKLGALFTIDNVRANNVLISNPITQTSILAAPFYKGYALYSKIELAFLNKLSFWMKGYFSNNSKNDYLISYLTPRFSTGISFKFYNKYLIGLDVSGYNLNTNDDFARLEYVLITSISIGYEFY